MAIDDNTSYELTGAQVKDLANKIKAKADDNIFVGATSAVPGSKGIVPAPQAGDDTKFLSGDGTWKTAGGGDATKVFYITAPLKNLVNSNFYIYTDAALTQAVDFVDFSITLRHSPAKLVYNAPSPNQSFSSYDIFIAGDDAFNFQDSDAECSRYYAIGDDGYPDYGIMKMYSISFCNSFASISRVLDFQPKLTAGTGINIDANNVISATGGGGGTTTFYHAKAGGFTRFYSDPAMTQLVTGQDIADAVASGTVYFSVGLGDLVTVISCLPQNNPGEYFFAVTNSNLMITYVATSTTEYIESVYTVQEELTAGSNISISGNTISATDTTYSDFTGASSSTAGANGLVPAPAAGDDTKFLSGDGTWKAVGGGGGGKTLLYYRTGTSSQIGIYTESSYTNKLTGQQVLDYLTGGSVEIVGPTSGGKTPRYDNIFCSTSAFGSFLVVFANDEGDITLTYSNLSQSAPTISYKRYKKGFDAQSYSTSEQNTYTTWTNGSVIYKKTIHTGTLPNSGNIQVAHGITFNSIVKVEGIAQGNSSLSYASFSLPFSGSVANPASFVQIWVDSTNITISTGSDRSAYDSYVTLYYTKS